MSAVSRGPGWEIRYGRWQDVLSDVRHPHAVITDVPYSQRVIEGQRSAPTKGTGAPRQAISYAALTLEDTRAFADDMMMRATRWAVSFCAHDQWRVFEEAFQQRADAWITFQPIPWVKTCMGTPRYTADGPSSSSEWLFITRPRGGFVARYRQGHYAFPREFNNRGVTGAKNLDLMRAIIRDYSEPGDLVCDPFVGSGTTILAAVMEGRRAIGAEVDPGRFYAAISRLGGEHPRVYPGDAL